MPLPPAPPRAAAARAARRARGAGVDLVAGCVQVELHRRARRHIQRRRQVRGCSSPAPAAARAAAPGARTSSAAGVRTAGAAARGPARAARGPARARRPGRPSDAPAAAAAARAGGAAGGAGGAPAAARGPAAAGGPGRPGGAARAGRRAARVAAAERRAHRGDERQPDECRACTGCLGRVWVHRKSSLRAVDERVGVGAEAPHLFRGHQQRPCRARPATICTALRPVLQLVEYSCQAESDNLSIASRSRQRGMNETSSTQ